MASETTSQAWQRRCHRVAASSVWGARAGKARRSSAAPCTFIQAMALASGLLPQHISRMSTCLSKARPVCINKRPLTHLLSRLCLMGMGEFKGLTRRIKGYTDPCNVNWQSRKHLQQLCASVDPAQVPAIAVLGLALIRLGAWQAMAGLSCRQDRQDVPLRGEDVEVWQRAGVGVQEIQVLCCLGEEEALHSVLQSTCSNDAAHQHRAACWYRHH